MRILDGSSLYSLAYYSRQYKNYIFADDWEYVEITFKASGQGKLNQFRKKTVYYGIMRMKLPRRLPNVVFDSIEHQHRQFRLVFDPKQNIQLEGNFNKYFATYFGNSYKIDDLSFITPEVMLALIAAKDYDIEIVHNSVLLFGQIQETPEAQLKEMSQKLHVIRKKLLNNILTYRDERVPYEEGRKVVARAGMFLEQRVIFGAFIYLVFGLLCIIPLFYIVVFIIALLAS